LLSLEDALLPDVELEVALLSRVDITEGSDILDQLISDTLEVCSVHIKE
jgi:hypothetical protein